MQIYTKIAKPQNIMAGILSSPAKLIPHDDITRRLSIILKKFLLLSKNITSPCTSLISAIEVVQTFYLVRFYQILEMALSLEKGV